jgi:hypothetical protein
MAKSISGVTKRAGSTMSIGDNRYGLREEYDPAVASKTLNYYRTGDEVTTKEVVNPLQTKVKVVKL